MSNNQYYSISAGYLPNPSTIYAEYHAGRLPNPCRKYHISSDIPSAHLIAEAALPALRERRVSHKVVKNQSFLARQSSGDSAGKFITLYMDASVPLMNETIRILSERLTLLKREHDVHPNPRIPRARSYHYVFIERPLDPNMFIYGGLVLDPTK